MHMAFYGAFCQVQLQADLFVAVTLRKQLHDGLLALGQHGFRMADGRFWHFHSWFGK